MTGSARYVEGLNREQRDEIALNVNLDSIGGSPRLAALTSGFAGIEPFLLSVAAANGHSLRCIRPLMMNSDHANFARAGIPALRMVAGFDDACSNLRLVLTPADTRDGKLRTDSGSTTRRKHRGRCMSGYGQDCSGLARATNF